MELAITSGTNHSARFDSSCPLAKLPSNETACNSSSYNIMRRKTTSLRYYHYKRRPTHESWNWSPSAEYRLCVPFNFQNSNFTRYTFFLQFVNLTIFSGHQQHVLARTNNKYDIDHYDSQRSKRFRGVWGQRENEEWESQCFTCATQLIAECICGVVS